MKPNKCALCRGKYGNEEIEDRIFVEPLNEDGSGDGILRAWMCRECAIVHWAWKVDEELPDASS